MTFDQIWNLLVLKEPKLRNPESEVTFKSKNLKSLLDQVYERGKKQPDAIDKLFGGLFK